jgi:DNA-binding GntR family transcriptional regulator
MKDRGERAGIVYRALRLAILEQVLEPGMKLPEDAIGEQFGVSRTVVRRALEQLSAEELVEILPNKGASIAKPSMAEARDLFSVRQDIENIVVKRVCGRVNPEQAQRLRAHVAAEEYALYNNRPEYSRLSAEFHVILAEISGSEMLLRYMRQLTGRSALILGLYGRPQWTNCSVQEHVHLIDALVEGNLKKVGSLMHAHLDGILTRALETAAADGPRGIREILGKYVKSSQVSKKRTIGHGQPHNEAAGS